LKNKNPKLNFSENMKQQVEKEFQREITEFQYEKNMKKDKVEIYSKFNVYVM